MFTFLEFALGGLGLFLLSLHSFRKLYDTINDRFCKAIQLPTKKITVEIKP
jgi:hypothetical protein